MTAARIVQAGITVLAWLDPDPCCAPERTAQTMAMLGRIERTDGVVVRVTGFDAPIWFQGERYDPADGWSLSEIEAASDGSVPIAEAELVIDTGDIHADDVARGLYQDATFDLWLVDAEDPETCPAQLRTGRIGTIDLARSGARWELRGLAQALQQPTGRIITPLCDAEFCDTRCGLAAEDFSLAGTVATVAGPRAITLAGDAAGFAAGMLDGGVITWTGGANAGRRSRVQAWDGTIATLLTAPPFAIETGDAFTALEGCGKRKAEDCRDRFDNVVNFRGFSFVPGRAEYLRYGTGP